MGYKFNDKPTREIQGPVKYIKRKIKEQKEDKKIQEEREYWEDVFENLENFDGTPESQKEVRNVGR